MSHRKRDNELTEEEALRREQNRNAQVAAQAEQFRRERIARSKSWPDLDSILGPNVVRSRFPQYLIVMADVRKDEEHYYPFKDGEDMLYMGEIHNMRGHVIVANRRGQIFWGYHGNNFRIIPEDET